jgi:hypothetical protein
VDPATNPLPAYSVRGRITARAPGFGSIDKEVTGTYTLNVYPKDPFTKQSGQIFVGTHPAGTKDFQQGETTATIGGKLEDGQIVAEYPLIGVFNVWYADAFDLSGIVLRRQ